MDICKYCNNKQINIKNTIIGFHFGGLCLSREMQIFKICLPEIMLEVMSNDTGPVNSGHRYIIEQ